MNSREAVAYLKGLLEGAPPADEGEKRLFDAIFCAIDSLSLAAGAQAEGGRGREGL